MIRFLSYYKKPNFIGDDAKTSIIPLRGLWGAKHHERILFQPSPEEKEKYNAL